jgi:endonuclease YncB( thermonuclease family)
MRLGVLLGAVLVVALATPIAGLRIRHDERSNPDVVSYVRDGDTIELEGGEVVRLVQVDTPELREGECYADSARAVLRRLLPTGTHVRVEEDPGLDHVDTYGRRLAYVFKGTMNVNRVLVARGAAGVWFFEGRRGRFAAALLSAERRAKAASRGLWRRCPGTRLDPLAPVDSGTG